MKASLDCVLLSARSNPLRSTASCAFLAGSNATTFASAGIGSNSYQHAFSKFYRSPRSSLSSCLASTSSSSGPSFPPIRASSSMPLVQLSPNIIYVPPPGGDDSATSSSSSNSSSSSSSSTSTSSSSDSSSSSSSSSDHTYTFSDSASEVSLSSMLTPEAIVSELDKNVIGQVEAKKAVAMALRNRWRRKQLGDRMKEEVKPHNILMIGPTGSGKTEIARRLARLASAPFYKTEMTRYTEVGIYGADVDSIIKDLVDASVRLEMDKARARVLQQATKTAENNILKRLKEEEGSKNQFSTKSDEELLSDLRAGKYNDIRLHVSYSAEDNQNEGSGSPFTIFAGASDMSKMFSKIGNLQGGRGRGGGLPSLMKAFAGGGGGAQRKREGMTTVQLLLKEFIERETNKLIDRDEIERTAVKNAEESGIVVLDEIDKLAGSVEFRSGGRKGEGVQKELLSIIEGTVVSTDYGNVRTDHILFIASGAFHSSKPSDLMPELQGRLPIRVQLANLTESDFFKILTETEYNLIEQQIALMKTEGILLEFTRDACLEIAKVTAQMNSRVENIGARRLNTIVSRIMETISFYAPTKVKQAKEKGESIYKETIDAKYVREKVDTIMQTSDLSKFIL